jgi:limonene 1,2-monooxygenase
LSLSVNSPQGFDAARSTWAIVEEAAAEAGRIVDRSNWRITQFCHIADSDEQARKDVRYGLVDFVDYLHHLNPLARFHDPELTDLDDIIDDMNNSGSAVIGGPQRLVDTISRLQDQTGGFGVFLSFVTEMADPAATTHSYELIASDVMPHFQGSNVRPMAAYRFASEPPPTGETTWSDITYAAYAKAGVIPTGGPPPPWPPER